MWKDRPEIHLEKMKLLGVDGFSKKMKLHCVNADQLMMQYENVEFVVGKAYLHPLTLVHEFQISHPAFR